MDIPAIRTDLIRMSQRLATPERDWVILGEGNTSARVSEESFLVKASGVSLRGIDAAGFVETAIEPVLALLKIEKPSDDQIAAGLEAARTDPDAKLRPSVETVIHALCLTLGGASFVGHTHPCNVNGLLCSQESRQAFSGRLFPDEIVVCGRRPIYIPYTDPGVPLARRIRDELRKWIETEEDRPRVILIENHGIFALGRDAREVESITMMMDKTARILIAAYAAGGPRYLSVDAADRIRTRPDEHYRRLLLGLESEDGAAPETS